MLLSAMMILGCWSGDVTMEHKYIEGGPCDDFTMEFSIGADGRLKVFKHVVACPSGFDTTWTELDFEMRDDGDLWKQPVRGDKRIVGWFKDGEFYAEDSLNAWMYSVFNAQYSQANEAEGTAESLNWQDRMFRTDEQNWAVTGQLSRVDCPEAD